MGVEEDPTGAGLVLEWVYGSIVSTAEKARDGAKRTLGAPRPAPPPPVGACRKLCSRVANTVRAPWQAGWPEAGQVLLGLAIGIFLSNFRKGSRSSSSAGRPLQKKNDVLRSSSEGSRS